MKSIAFLNLVKEKFTNSRAEKKQKEIKESLEEFIRFCSLYLEWDHPFTSYHDHIDKFTEKYIKTGLIDPNKILNGKFNYTHHFNDTWEKYGVKKRFYKEYTYDLKDATLLHLACLVGNVNMVNTLLEKGADKRKLNTNGQSPENFLFFNQNYMSELNFKNIQKKVALPKSTIKLVKK